MRSFRSVTLFTLALILCGLTVNVISKANQAPKNGSTSDSKEAESQAAKGAQVFKEIMDIPDKAIPQSIVDNAECIAVFPSVLKAGFIVGGRGGRGLVSCRKEDRSWSAPVFLKIGGGSFGLQIGAEAVDIVLVVMNKKAAELFTKGRFKLGGEASATAGPVGRTAAAESDLPTLRSQILSYSRSRGVFAGLELEGSVITRDEKLNQAVYGRNQTPDKILHDAKASPSVQTFAKTLASYSHPKAK